MKSVLALTGLMGAPNTAPERVMKKMRGVSGSR